MTMPVSTEALAQTRPMRVAFSGSNAASVPGDVYLTVPWLAGDVCEEIFSDMQLAGGEGGLALSRRGELLVGHISEVYAGDDLALQSQRLYQRILQACRGRSMYRIWNYVPRINVVNGGIEQYRAFCRGRSLAFEPAWGPEYKRFLPAASAVGCEDERISVVFVAGRAAPRHIENPEQVPAYEYPQEHGPRAPSFARATVAAESKQRFVFVSGTAAIKGHVTVAPGALSEQIACTLDNLCLISRASGVGDHLGAGEGWTRHFKIYLRHARDLPVARAELEGTLLRRGDRVTWLRADICRAALNIEIEATLVGA